MLLEGAKVVTLVGLKPTRNYSNQFIVDHLNRSETVVNHQYTCESTRRSMY